MSPFLKNMEPLWEADNCSQKELDYKEKELIKEYNTIYPNGYNLTEGHSMKTKQLLSEKSKNMWVEKREAAAMDGGKEVRSICYTETTLYRPSGDAYQKEIFSKTSTCVHRPCKWRKLSVGGVRKEHK